MRHTPWSKHIVARMRLEGAIADLKDVFSRKNEPCLILTLVDVQADARRWIVRGFRSKRKHRPFARQLLQTSASRRASRFFRHSGAAPIEVVETESSRLQGKTIALSAPASFGVIPCTGPDFWIAALVK